MSPAERHRFLMGAVFGALLVHVIGVTVGRYGAQTVLVMLSLALLYAGTRA